MRIVILHPTRLSYILSILGMLTFVSLCSAQDDDLDRGAITIPDSKGIYVYWKRLPGVSYSILRGTTPDNMVVIVPDIAGEPWPPRPGSRFLDTTAEPGTRYYYKVVGHSQVIEAKRSTETFIFVRDFRTNELVVSPMSDRDLYFPQYMGNQPRNGQIEITSGINTPASYQRFFDNLKPGHPYTARITFGIVEGPATNDGGYVRISLGMRRPGVEFFANLPTASTYKNKTVEFKLVSGPVGWHQFAIEVMGNKGQNFRIYIKRIEVFETSSSASMNPTSIAGKNAVSLRF